MDSPDMIQSIDLREAMDQPRQWAPTILRQRHGAAISARIAEDLRPNAFGLVRGYLDPRKLDAVLLTVSLELGQPRGVAIGQEPRQGLSELKGYIPFIFAGEESRIWYWDKAVLTAYTIGPGTAIGVMTPGQHQRVRDGYPVNPKLRWRMQFVAREQYRPLVGRLIENYLFPMLDREWWET